MKLLFLIYNILLIFTILYKAYYNNYYYYNMNHFGYQHYYNMMYYKPNNIYTQSYNKKCINRMFCNNYIEKGYCPYVHTAYNFEKPFLDFLYFCEFIQNLWIF